MKCYWCNSTRDNFYPIDPRGTKGRRWICEDCLYSAPFNLGKKLYKRGQRATVMLTLKICCNRVVAKFTR